MHQCLVRVVLATALACASGSACAMTADAPPVECTVVNAGKLSEESGGSDALCQAIKLALGKQAPGKKVSVEITVLGPSRIAASVMLPDGSKIAEQKYGSMDKELTRSSFERFAQSLAVEVSKAGSKSL